MRRRLDRTEKRADALCCFVDVAGFAIPDHEHPPTGPPELSCMFLISRNIARELGCPVAGVGFGAAGIEAGCFDMHMPKTAVDEDDFLACTEHEVRLAGQVFAMETIAEAEGGRDAADDEFRLGVFGFDRRHVGRAAGWGEFIWQVSDLWHTHRDKFISR